MNITMEDFNTDKDLGNRRTIETANNKFLIQKYDPYGFWKIHTEKGRVPEVLSGTYTAFEYAKRDVENYLKLKDQVPVSK